MASVQPSQYPASSKQSSGLVHGTLVTANLISFTDKLLLTLSGTSGKLSHWVHVPLSGVSADPMNPSFSATGGGGGGGENSLLPRTDLTATTVLGGTKREDEAVGQTLATTLASAILVKRPSEERMLVLGLGLDGAGSLERSGFEEVVGLCLDVL